jgi:transcriptional regulator with XRE-family HTH domain
MANVPDPVDVAVGGRIRLRRKSLKVSQASLADAVGVTFQQVQKYERGSNRVSASMLTKIAATLETSCAGLMGEGAPEPQHDQVFEQLAVPGAVEVLAAYASINDTKVRRAVINLLQTMSELTDHRHAEAA